MFNALRSKAILLRTGFILNLPITSQWNRLNQELDLSPQMARGFGGNFLKAIPLLGS